MPLSIQDLDPAQKAFFKKYIKKGFDLDQTINDHNDVVDLRGIHRDGAQAAFDWWMSEFPIFESTFNSIQEEPDLQAFFR